jgi:hypothetical protein
MAVSINYDMDQGSDFSFTLTAKNEDGTPKDITYDYNVLCQMRKYYSSSTYYPFTASVLDSANGLIKISMLSAQTSEIKPGVYFYDVELQAASTNQIEPNVVKRLQQGMITVYPEVTKF